MPLKKYKISVLVPSNITLGNDKRQFTIEEYGEVELPSEDVCFGAVIHMDDGTVFTINAITMRPRHYISSLAVLRTGKLQPQPAPATTENKN